MMTKSVCFAGHRFEWHCIGVEEKLLEVLETLVKHGYTTFYDGDHGAFDKICRRAVLTLQQKYPDICIVKVLSSYNSNNQKYELPDFYSGSVYPDLETVHFKRKIEERNKWIINKSDILVCHIVNTTNSGAYKMVKYAKSLGKKIIFV